MKFIILAILTTGIAFASIVKSQTNRKSAYCSVSAFTINSLESSGVGSWNYDVAFKENITLKTKRIGTSDFYYTEGSHLFILPNKRTIAVQIKIDSSMDDLTLEDHSELSISARLQSKSQDLIDTKSDYSKNIHRILEVQLIDYKLKSRVIKEAPIDIQDSTIDLEKQLSDNYTKVLENGVSPIYSVSCELD